MSKILPPIFSGDERGLPKSAQEWITEQLDYYYIDFTKRIEIPIVVCTFNVNERRTTEDLSSWLRIESNPALLVVGLQEIDMSPQALVRNETDASLYWTNLLTSYTRSAAFKKQAEYELLTSKQMVGLYLAVFAHNSLKNSVKDVQVTTLATGSMMGTLGNKGAIGIRLVIHRTSILFVNSHLAAHVSEVNKRNRDFESILQSLVVESSGCPVLPKDHDILLVFGDLNYRVQGYTQEQASLLVKQKRWDLLMEKDQLHEQLASRCSCWTNFSEATPNFPPTYRYDPGSSTFDSSEKKRVPAYTDRILWWVRNTAVRNSSLGCMVQLRQVNTFSDIKCSDHKPLSAVFSLSVLKEVPRKRSIVIQSLRKQIDSQGYDNVIVPGLQLNTHTVLFEKLFYGAKKKIVVLARNLGHSVIKVNAYRFEYPASSTEIPPFNAHTPLIQSEWLSVTPLERIIFPSEEVSFTFEAIIDTESLQFQKHYPPFCGVERFLISKCIVLQPSYGPPKHILASAYLYPSCFGNTLDNIHSLGLTSCIEGFRNLRKTEFSHEFYSVKELWHLINCLYTTNVRFADFETIDHIDTLNPFCYDLDCGNFAALATCDAKTIASIFVHFLSSLQDPIVPLFYQHLFSESHPTEYVRVLSLLPKVNYHSFLHVVSYLKYLLGNDKDTDRSIVEAVVASFSKIMFKGFTDLRLDSSNNSKTSTFPSFFFMLLSTDITFATH